jgi:hypothetical protein
VGITIAVVTNNFISAEIQREAEEAEFVKFPMSGLWTRLIKGRATGRSNIMMKPEGRGPLRLVQSLETLRPFGKAGASTETGA